MEWLENILNDKKIMRNVRLGFAITLALALGLLYFGFYEQFSIEALFNVGVGALSIIGFISWYIVWIEISEYAKSTECDTNENISKLEKQIDNDLKQLDYENEDIGIAFVDEYNEIHQNNANKRKTLKLISKVQREIRSKKYSGKDYQALEKELEFLKTNPVFDKSYKPITFKKLISLNSGSTFKLKKENENVDLDYDPKTDGAITAAMLGIFKTFGLGLNAVIPFIINDWIALVVYYVMLIIWILSSGSRRYIKVRYKTSTKYLDRLRNQARLISEIVKRTQEQKKPQNDIQVEKEDNVRVEGNNGVSEAFNARLPIQVIE